MKKPKSFERIWYYLAISQVEAIKQLAADKGLDKSKAARIIVAAGLEAIAI